MISPLYIPPAKNFFEKGVDLTEKKANSYASLGTRAFRYAVCGLRLIGGTAVPFAISAEGTDFRYTSLVEGSPPAHPVLLPGSCTWLTGIAGSCRRDTSLEVRTFYWYSGRVWLLGSLGHEVFALIDVAVGNMGFDSSLLAGGSLLAQLAQKPGIWRNQKKLCQRGVGDKSNKSSSLLAGGSLFAQLARRPGIWRNQKRLCQPGGGDESNNLCLLRQSQILPQN